jgi:hypothetical protein
MRNKSKTNAQATAESGMKRAQNKENPDYRSNEEQDNKGQDQTHNEKETKEKHLKVKMEKS